MVSFSCLQQQDVVARGPLLLRGLTAKSLNVRWNASSHLVGSAEPGNSAWTEIAAQIRAWLQPLPEPVDCCPGQSIGGSKDLHLCGQQTAYDRHKLYLSAFCRASNCG